MHINSSGLKVPKVTDIGFVKKSLFGEMSANGNAWATNFQGPLGPRSVANKLFCKLKIILPLKSLRKL